VDGHNPALHFRFCLDRCYQMVALRIGSQTYDSAESWETLCCVGRGVILRFRGRASRQLALLEHYGYIVRNSPVFGSCYICEFAAFPIVESAEQNWASKEEPLRISYGTNLFPLCAFECLDMVHNILRGKLFPHFPSSRTLR